ncbi:hypothetical protein HOY80DRAFT_1134689 [Tuber brumale]|nr:hypothetical protein HOY80DRAFT_1134689 [Tuber brumale]
MSPSAFIFAVAVIARLAAAYPIVTDGAIPSPSPTSNSSIQTASAGATPTPGGSPPPNAEVLPVPSKNALDSPGALVGSGPAVQAINLNLESVPQNNPIRICAQRSGSELASVTTVDHVFWVLPLSVVLLVLSAIRSTLHIYFDIKAYMPPRDGSKEDPEEKQPRKEKTIYRETAQAGDISNSDGIVSMLSSDICEYPRFPDRLWGGFE